MFEEFNNKKTLTNTLLGQKKELTVKTNNQKMSSPERKQSQMSTEEVAAKEFPELPSATKKKAEDETLEENASEKVEEVNDETPTAY